MRVKEKKYTHWTSKWYTDEVENRTSDDHDQPSSFCIRWKEFHESNDHYIGRSELKVNETGDTSMCRAMSLIYLCTKSKSEKHEKEND